MGNRLTAVQLQQAGSVICSATEGDASADRTTVKLTKGIKWAVPKPLDWLQKQVALTATIHGAGVPTKSFVKKMYISGMLGDGGNVRLTDTKEG